MDRVSLLFIRSRPVLDFHWLESAACSRGVNEPDINLNESDSKRMICFAAKYFSSPHWKVNPNLGFTNRAFKLQIAAGSSQFECQDLVTFLAAHGCFRSIIFFRWHDYATPFRCCASWIK